MQIAVENFRSFLSTGLMRSSDLNVFIGKNSSGKSSLLRLYPLLKQTLSNETSQPFLWYSPDYVDFGEYDDVLGNDKDAPITFSFKFDLDPRNLYSFSNREDYSFMNPLSMDQYLKRINELPDLNIDLKLTTKRDFLSKIVFSILGVTIELGFSKDRLLNFTVNGSILYSYKNSNNKGIRVYPVKRNLMTVVQANYTKSSNRSMQLNSTTTDSINRGTLLKHLFKDTYIFPELLKLMYNLYSETDLKSSDVEEHFELVTKSILIGDFLTLDRIHLRDRINEFFIRDFPYEKTDPIIDMFIACYFNDFLIGIDNHLKSYFSRVKYIAPLRATVQRYYRMQGIAVSEMDASGANIPMIIANMSPRDFSGFQAWTHENFNFVIERSPTQGHISILIRFGTETPRNIIDLGFGYSQLLPIIVEIWNTSNREKIGSSRNIKVPYTIVIEQPELHLHPAMQAEFIDVCTKIVGNNQRRNNKKIKFVIETHSQTIINRISESIRKEKLSKESVSVNIVNIDSDNNSSVKSIEFDEKGQLTEWPIGFFSPESIKYDYKF